ncbi:MAG TPA: MFS transporter [Blastocatellia bacterium]|nr:MFS transporter [Blastocatellia bacterium]
MSQARAFWAIYISVAVSYLGVGLVAPLIAIVLSEHGANSLLVGLVGTTMFAALTLASFPIGTLTDRIGPKPILIFGLVLYGISILLFALMQATWLFFLARAIEGVGGAAISVTTTTMVSQLSGPHERARRMSYYALSVGLGWAVGPLAGTLLFGIFLELPFILCFVLSLISAALAAVLIPKTAPSAHEHDTHVTSISANIFVPISAGALYGYLMSSLVTLIPLYLQAINVEEREMGIIITAVVVGTLISQVPIGKAADRFGKRRTLLVCASLLTVVFAIMPFHADWRPFILTGGLTGALAGSLYPIALAMIGGNVPKERIGAATALFSLAFGIGSLVGPAVSGLAMDHLGYRWLFYLPSLLTALFSLILVALYGKTVARRRKMVNNNLRV